MVVTVFLYKCKQCFNIFLNKIIAWKVSLFRVFVIHIFPYSDWIRRDTELLTALEQIKFMQLDLKVINLSGKGKSMAFFIKNWFAHNTFVISIFYSSRWNSSRFCIISNIIILHSCLLRNIMRFIPFWSSPIGQPNLNKVPRL